MFSGNDTNKDNKVDKKVLEEEIQSLILANHILHYHHVLDAYGHVSMRQPGQPHIFLMSGDRAPALVSSPRDIIQYHVSDASPVQPGSKKGYQERFIHSEIYKRFPGVNSVIHSHSESVLPYTMSGVEMKPCFHIAGFLGIHVPNFDLLPHYTPEDQQDMLVNNTTFGSALAAHFTSSPIPTSSPTSSDPKATPDHNVVLMASHGFTTIGTSIKQAVYRAIYTHINAGIQTNAIMLRSAAGPQANGSGGIRYLNEEQVKGSLKMNEVSQDRPWGLWAKEVEACGLYVKQE